MSSRRCSSLGVQTPTNPASCARLCCRRLLTQCHRKHALQWRCCNAEHSVHLFKGAELGAISSVSLHVCVSALIASGACGLACQPPLGLLLLRSQLSIRAVPAADATTTLSNFACVHFLPSPSCCVGPEVRKRSPENCGCYWLRVPECRCASAHVRAERTCAEGNRSTGCCASSLHLHQRSWCPWCSPVADSRQRCGAAAFPYHAAQFGWTPLYKAAWEGHVDVVKALLEGGRANPNSSDMVRPSLRRQVRSRNAGILAVPHRKEML